MTDLADVDLRALLPGTVHHQGARPLCLPFALSAVHEGALSAVGPAIQSLAPEAIWAYAFERHRTSPDGMLLADGAVALAESGQPFLEEWPYDPTIAADQAGSPPPDLRPAPWFRAQTAELPLDRDGVEAALEHALADRQVVLLIVAVTDSFFYAREGFVGLVVDDVPVGSHAVACVGAATHPDRGRCLLIKNSWGARWGRGGYGWVTLEYVARFGLQAATVSI